MKIPDAKAAVDKEWKKLETIPAWDVRKVKIKKEVLKEGQKNNNKVHFASLMYLCHLRNDESKIHARIAGKGFTSMTQYNLVHKFIPMPQAINIPDAKAAEEKGMEKARDNPSMATGRSRAMNICHLKNAESEPKLKNTKAESCSVVTL